MKKLLLLALTVTAATSLTACGGMGELEDFIEVLNQTNAEVAFNFTLESSWDAYDNYLVDGTNVQFWDADSDSDIAYLQTGEKTEGGNFKRWYCDLTDTTLEWTSTSSSSYDRTPSNLFDDYTIEDFAKDGDVYYYTFEGTITSAELSGLTVEFTKDDNGDQVVTVTYGSYTQVYTNIGTTVVDLTNLADADTAA